MRKELQKYLSLVLCALFLFPMVEKQVHAFEHKADKHCTASEKHFHEQEHHCTICDFTITDATDPVHAAYSYVASFRPHTFSSAIESVYTPYPFQDIPARAPPVALV